MFKNFRRGLFTLVFLCLAGGLLYAQQTGNGTNGTGQGTTGNHGSSGGPPTGAAGGVLSGSYPNPSLASTALASPPAIGGTTPAAGTFTTASGVTFVTATNCAANGTGASPSVVSCGAAAAGMFSCATNASTATCQVNTTAVTANSEISITQNAADGGASQLNVTCNTSSDLPSTKPILLSKSAGANFIINLGTVSVNPACFEYAIVN